MTYLHFHLVFILPPIALLSLALRSRRDALPARASWSLPAVAAIAFLYTTPWDNYLVRSGVWGYGEDRVIGTIGSVPVEEYLFFLLQPVLTGLWLYLLLALRPPGASGGRRSGARAGDAGGPRGGGRRSVEGSLVLRGVGAAGWLGLALLGVLLLRSARGTYLGLILVWAAPVLAAQWAWAAPAIRARAGTIAVAVAVPTLYLWLADWTALRAGIWQIASATTTGVALAGLPIEEAVFFLLTNVLVVQGILLFLDPSAAPFRGAGRRR